MRMALSLSVASAMSVVTACVVVGCGEAPPRPIVEDQARLAAPIPACIMYLPPRKNLAGTARTLREDQYWKLVFPAFDAEHLTLDPSSVDCVGRPILNSWLLQGADPLRGTPLQIQSGDIVFGAGGDKLKVVWLRTHKFPDGTYGGPLAIVRAQENFAELYADGIWVGRPDKARLSLERMGPEVVISAVSDGCTGLEPGTTCETREQVFLPRKGQLMPIGDFPLERRMYAFNTEPGAKGKMEFRMTTVPSYLPTGIKVFEQVAVRDERGRELRNAQVERTLTLMDSGEMKASDPPIWPKIWNNGQPFKAKK